MTESIEVILLRWGDSSAQGRTVTFLLPEDAGEHPFKGERNGKTGQRYAMALAKIGDDEAKADAVFGSDGYVEGSAPEKTDEQRAVIRAALLCKEPAFRKWCGVTSEQGAITYMRNDCGVASRGEFATNPEALEKFKRLETSYRFQQRAA